MATSALADTPVPYSPASSVSPQTRQEQTTHSRVFAQWDEGMKAFAGHRQNCSGPGVGTLMGGGAPRLAGMVLDFDTLLQLGIPGLRQRVRDAAATAGGDTNKAPFYDGLRPESHDAPAPGGGTGRQLRWL